MSIVVPFLGYLLIIGSSIKKYVHCSSFFGLPSIYRILNKKNMSIVVPFLGYLLFIASSIKIWLSQKRNDKGDVGLSLPSLGLKASLRMPDTP